MARRGGDVHRATQAGLGQDVAVAVEELARHVAAGAVVAEGRHRIAAEGGLAPSLHARGEPAGATRARDHVDDAREALAAPADRGSAAHDLDALDHLHRDLAPAYPAEVGVVQGYAVHEHERAAGGGAPQSPNGHGLPGGVRDAGLEREAEVEARDFLQDVLECLRGGKAQLLARDRRHVDRDVSHGSGRAQRRDDQLAQRNHAVRGDRILRLERRGRPQPPEGKHEKPAAGTPERSKHRFTSRH